jgi:hypothetical protein
MACIIKTRLFRAATDLAQDEFYPMSGQGQHNAMLAALSQQIASDQTVAGSSKKKKKHRKA